MRKEMSAYDARTSGRQRFFEAHELRRKVEFSLLRRYLPLPKVGSHSWHLMQEKMSKRSSVGLDLSIRNWFYEQTLPNTPEDLCVFPDTIMHYPQNIYIGKNVFINRGVLITAPAPITIGNDVLIGPYVVFNSANHTFADGNDLIRNQGHDLGPIEIGDDVWLGARVTILAGVKVGEGAVIGAGAVVTNDVEPYSVMGGAPARVIKRRRP